MIPETVPDGWKINPEWKKVSDRQDLARRVAIASGWPDNPGFTYDFDPNPLRLQFNKDGVLEVQK